MMNKFLAPLFALALFCFSAGAAHAACTSPASNEGEMMYNADYHVMQYCNGAAWIGMGGGGVSGTLMPSTAALGAACTPNGAISNDGAGKLLVCTSGTWAAQSTGGIQSGMTNSGTLGAACTVIGALVKDSNNKLLVCDDDPSIIKNYTCATFTTGAITYDVIGAQYVCTE